MTELYVATGKTSGSSKITRQLQLSFEKLVALLKAYPLHVGQLPVAEYLRLKGGTKADKTAAAADKDTAWFSLSKYSRPTRRAENVELISAFVGDFDTGAFSVPDFAERLEGLQYVLLTTYSHTVDHPKYRVIVPYSRPVTPDEHAQLFEHFMARFGEEVDSSTRDACRLWYFPSACADTKDQQFVLDFEGVTFDPDTLVVPTTLASDDVLPQKELSDASVNDALAYQPDFVRPEEEEVRKMLAHIFIPDVANQRRSTWFTVMCGVHDWSAGGDDGFQLIAEWSASQPGYVDDDDVRKTWDSCGRSSSRVTIATVIKLALDGGYTSVPVDEDEIVPDPDPEVIPIQLEIPLDGGARTFWDQVNSAITGGSDPAIAALSVLEADLIFVTDQQEYFSTRHHTLITKDAIKQLYRSSMPKMSNGKKMDPCKLLENSQTKRIVSSMGYHPGEGQIFTEYDRLLVNGHRAYPVDPLKPTAYELSLFKTLLQHLFPAGGDTTFKSYLLQFFAHSVQKKGVKIGSAPLLYSTETGTGKTTMMYEIPRALFGPLNCTVVSNDEIESQFSDFLAKSHVIHLDEIFMGGMRQAAAAANKFKPYVTNSTVRVHPKGFSGYDAVNRLIVTACSNYEDALHLTDHDRRWAVQEITSGKMDKAFAADFYQFLYGPRGPGVLTYIFQQIPLTGFNPHADAPMTVAKKAMITASLNDEQSMLRDAFESRSFPFHNDLFQLEEVGTWLEAQLDKKLSPKRLAKAIQMAVPAIKRLKRIRWGKSRLWVWCCRNRENWDGASVTDLGAALGLQDVIADEVEEDVAA